MTKILDLTSAKTENTPQPVAPQMRHIPQSRKCHQKNIFIVFIALIFVSSSVFIGITRNLKTTHDPAPNTQDIAHEQTTKPQKSNISQYLYTNITNIATVVDKLIIQHGGDDIIANDPIRTITVRAVDRLGNTVEGYRGRIKFASTDTTALLPGEFQFTAANKGKKQFDLAVKFNRIGAQTLTAFDTNNQLVKGEMIIDVRLADGTTASTSPNSPALPAPEILSPTDGTTIGGNSIIIAGISEPDANVKIYDGVSHILTITANNRGSFRGELTALIDGNHRITAIAEQNGENSTISDTINITIDSNPPIIQQIQLYPPESLPRARVDIQIESESNLPKAQIIIDKRIIELQQTGQTIYKNWFYAPILEGNYPIDIILGDNLGNQQKYADQITLKVTNTPNTTDPLIQTPVYTFPTDILADSTDTNIKTTTEAPTGMRDPDPRCRGPLARSLRNPLTGEYLCRQSASKTIATDTAPPTDYCTTPVTNLKITNSQNNRISLSWDPTSNAAHYKIYFGETQNNLTYSELTSLGKTAWTITVPNLTQNWHFSVIPVDATGKECSLDTANIVKFESQNQKPPQNKEIETPKLKTIPKSGPEAWFLLLAIIAVAGIAHFAHRKR